MALDIVFPLRMIVPVVALACGAAATVLFTGRRAWLRRRRRAAEDAAARAARRDAAVRILWAASGDFLSAGWGRNDLESLRLLALNLDKGQVLGPRLAARLRTAVTAVLSGVLDRLQDVVVTAREVELAPRTVGRLEAAIRVLTTELEDAGCKPGSAVPFRPAAVAHAATQAVESCAALRDALRPHMVSDPAEVLRALAGTRHAARLASGELILDLAAMIDARVAARAPDLAGAFDELLRRVFDTGRAVGPVRVGGRVSGPDVVLSISWTVPGPEPPDPRWLTESLRVLSPYGARLGLKDALEDGVVRIEAVLPMFVTEDDVDDVAQVGVS